MSERELKELLDFSVSAAREAGDITLRYFRKKFETRLKGKDNFVTQADLEAEEFLRRRISERFPDDAVIGEADKAEVGPGPGDSEAAAGAAARVPRLGDVLEELYAVIEGRRREMPAGSYTTYLFEKGLNKILKKVGEESAETIIAAKDEDLSALTAETADLVYHLLVLMVERGLTPEALGGELARRRGGKGGE